MAEVLLFHHAQGLTDGVLTLAESRVPLVDTIVAVSGRLGYELIEKVVLAGAPIVVAVSAPSHLAIDVAERFGVAVCGFVRGVRMNVYSHGWRVT